MPGHEGGRQGRARRMGRRYWQRLEDAKTDLDRLGASYDHLRTVIGRLQGESRQRAISHAMADLTGLAEQLLTEYQRPGRRSSK